MRFRRKLLDPRLRQCCRGIYPALSERGKELMWLATCHEDRDWRLRPSRLKVVDSDLLPADEIVRQDLCRHSTRSRLVDYKQRPR